MSRNIYNNQFKFLIMSNSIELVGRVKNISDKQTIQSRNGDLDKRVMTLELGDTYPVDYPVEAIGTKAGLFDNYKVNDQVKVGVNLRSYLDKNGELRTANCNVWRITYADGSLPGQTKSHEDNVEKFVNEGEDALAF